MIRVCSTHSCRTIELYLLCYPYCLALHDASQLVRRERGELRQEVRVRVRVTVRVRVVPNPIILALALALTLTLTLALALALTLTGARTNRTPG